MVGCMVATSLAMAPAMLLAQGADLVDLDGPLLLARDREPALRYDGALRAPAGAPALGLTPAVLAPGNRAVGIAKGELALTAGGRERERSEYKLGR